MRINLFGGNKGTEERDLRIRFDLGDQYRAGFPSAEVARSDSNQCEMSSCPECKKSGLLYRPFVSAAGSYRAIAVCSSCGFAVEF